MYYLIMAVRVSPFDVLPDYGCPTCYVDVLPDYVCPC